MPRPVTRLSSIIIHLPTHPSILHAIHPSSLPSFLPSILLSLLSRLLASHSLTVNVFVRTRLSANVIALNFSTALPAAPPDGPAKSSTTGSIESVLVASASAAQDTAGYMAVAERHGTREGTPDAPLSLAPSSLSSLLLSLSFPRTLTHIHSQESLKRDRTPRGSDR